MKTSDTIGIGIDLGTSYCSVAVFRNGIVTIIEDEQGKRRIPSYVAFSGEEYLVGDPAKVQGAVNPRNTINGIKRLLGRKLNDDIVSANRKSWPFKVEDKEGKLRIRVEYRSCKQHFSPEEIAAILLIKMKEMAETFLGHEVFKAVISVPANFNYLQRQAVLDAARIGGLEVLQLINEPTAAALAYCIEKKVKDSRNLLIFDIGGGSFDASLVTIQNRKLEVKAASGETYLGGKDFDNKLFETVRNEFQESLANSKHQKRFSVRLKNSCEIAKQNLSKVPEARIEIDGCDYVKKVKREWFNNCNDLFAKMMEHVERVLKDVGINRSSVDILLIGGSTRIPNIEEQLQIKFPEMHISKGINRDEAVAYGAAAQAAILLKDKSESLCHLADFQDITPNSDTVIQLNNTIVAQIPRYTKIPYDGMILKFLTANADEEFHCTISGLSKKDDKKVLDAFHLRLLGTKQQQQQNSCFAVRICIDDNGILRLKSGNNNQTLQTINARNSISKEEMEGMISRIQKLKGDREDYMEVMRCRDKLEGNIIRIEREIQDLQNTSMRDMIMDKCYEISDWMREDERATKEQLENKSRELENFKNQVLSLAYPEDVAPEKEHVQDLLPANISFQDEEYTTHVFESVSTETSISFDSFDFTPLAPTEPHRLTDVSHFPTDSSAAKDTIETPYETPSNIRHNYETKKQRPQPLIPTTDDLPIWAPQAPKIIEKAKITVPPKHETKDASNIDLNIKKASKVVNDDSGWITDSTYNNIPSKVGMKPSDSHRKESSNLAVLNRETPKSSGPQDHDSYPYYPANSPLRPMQTNEKPSQKPSYFGWISRHSKDKKTTVQKQQQKPAANVQTASYTNYEHQETQYPPQGNYIALGRSSRQSSTPSVSKRTDVDSQKKQDSSSFSGFFKRKPKKSSDEHKEKDIEVIQKGHVANAKSKYEPDLKEPVEISQKTKKKGLGLKDHRSTETIHIQYKNSDMNKKGTEDGAAAAPKSKMRKFFARNFR